MHVIFMFRNMVLYTFLIYAMTSYAVIYILKKNWKKKN